MEGWVISAIHVPVVLDGTAARVITTGLEHTERQYEGREGYEDLVLAVRLLRKGLEAAHDADSVGGEVEPVEIFLERLE